MCPVTCRVHASCVHALTGDSGEWWPMNNRGCGALLRPWWRPLTFQSSGPGTDLSLDCPGVEIVDICLS
jgi:hypothetical protein